MENNEMDENKRLGIALCLLAALLLGSLVAGSMPAGLAGTPAAVAVSAANDDFGAKLGDAAFEETAEETTIDPANRQAKDGNKESPSEPESAAVETTTLKPVVEEAVTPPDVLADEPPSIADTPDSATSEAEFIESDAALSITETTETPDQVTSAVASEESVSVKTTEGKTTEQEELASADVGVAPTSADEAPVIVSIDETIDEKLEAIDEAIDAPADESVLAATVESDEFVTSIKEEEEDTIGFSTSDPEASSPPLPDDSVFAPEESDSDANAPELGELVEAVTDLPVAPNTETTGIAAESSDPAPSSSPTTDDLVAAAEPINPEPINPEPINPEPIDPELSDAVPYVPDVTQAPDIENTNELAEPSLDPAPSQTPLSANVAVDPLSPDEPTAELGRPTAVADKVSSKKPFFGVGIRDSTTSIVTTLYAGSTAQRLGILLGDEIVSVNDETISNLTSLRSFLSSRSFGDNVSVVIKRANATLRLGPVPLGGK